MGVILTRAQVLTIGPLILVAVSYAISAPARSLPANRITEPTKTCELDLHLPLEQACLQSREELKDHLPAGWNVATFLPYVLAGDLTTEALSNCYQETIRPTAQILTEQYFRSEVGYPIQIVLCSSPESFQIANELLEGQTRDQYAGLYVRSRRRLIVNMDSGEGTLAHELTHALAHGDFPGMPEWFDEGLASLHEECEFSSDGTQLIGNSNWRVDVARDALTGGELRLIADLTSKPFGSRERAQVDYAHVRTLCLYLQQKGVLSEFYNLSRINSTSDPTGIKSLCTAAGCVTVELLEDQFRSWLLKTEKLSTTQR